MKKILIIFLTLIRWSIEIGIFTIIIVGFKYLINRIIEFNTFKALISILDFRFVLFLIFLNILWKGKRSIIYLIYAFIKGLLGYFIFNFYNTIQILNSNFSKIKLKNIIIPFSGKTIFELEKLDKKLLKEKSSKNLNLVKKIDLYFSTNKILNGIHVIDIVKVNNATIIDLYKPKGLISGKITNVLSNDILAGIGLSVKKYTLTKEVNNNIKFIITEKVNKNIYKIQDYIENFSKNKIYFGYDVTGKAIEYTINLTEANHFGVYGTTGGGKTNFTTSILYTLYLKNKNFNFYVIDTKGDLADFENLERINYTNSINDILKICKKIRAEMDSINKEFKRLKVRNYKEYLDKEKNKNNLIKPTFIFFEEFSMLLSKIDNKDLKNEVIKTVKEISIAGRSIAYNLILSLQIPLIKVINDSEITRMIKPISFRIDNSLNQNIFGSKVDYDLNSLNIGEGIFKNGGDIVKFKSFLVEKYLLDDLEKFRKKSKSNLSKEYLNFAKNINSFSKTEGMNFGLSRIEFDNLSLELQKNGIIKKASNNVLTFSKDIIFE